MKIWVDAFITSGSVSKTLDMMLEAFMESLILISALHTEMQIAYSAILPTMLHTITNERELFH